MNQTLLPMTDQAILPSAGDALNSVINISERWGTSSGHPTDRLVDGSAPFGSIRSRDRTSTMPKFIRDR